MPTTYSTRDEAVQREIVEPILAGDVDSIEEYDVEAIAAAVLGDHSQGFACLVTPEKFWQVVEDNIARTAGASYDPSSDAWRVEIRLGAWDDYVVETVLDVESGEESDARTFAAEIAKERGIRVRS